MSNEEKRRYVWKVMLTGLYGLKVEIIHSSSEELIGKKGIIIDETKNMCSIKLEERSKIITIPKKDQLFSLELRKDIIILVKGKTLIGTPEMRIKKRLWFW